LCLRRLFSHIDHNILKFKIIGGVRWSEAIILFN
jgi:hypothetical protein